MRPMDPYLKTGKEGQVRFCPVAKKAVATGKGSANTAWRFGVYLGSYAINSALYVSDYANPGNRYANIGETDSKVPAFLDGAWYETETIAGVTWPSSLKSGHNWIMDRHSMAICIGFVDGHSERVDLSYVFDQQWNKTFRRMGKQTNPGLGIK